MHIYKSGAFAWTFVTHYACPSHSKLGSPDVQLYKHKVSHYSTVKQSPCSLRKRVFVCIEMLINCSNRLHSDHREILFNESISSCSIHVHFPSGQTDSNCQLQSLPPLTVGPIKGWMFWSDSFTQSFTWRKKWTYHNAINHQRASGVSWCHGQLQKGLLIKFYLFCVDLCVKSLKIWSGTGACSSVKSDTSTLSPCH